MKAGVVNMMGWVRESQQLARAQVTGETGGCIALGRSDRGMIHRERGPKALRTTLGDCLETSDGKDRAKEEVNMQ